MNRRHQRLLALCLLALPFLTTAAAAEEPFPGVTQPAGVWRQVGKIETGTPALVFADANHSAHTRSGDIVHGRVAYLYLAPQSNGQGKYLARIQEGDFDCRARTLRWRAQADIDFAADLAYQNNDAAQTAFSPPAQGSVEDLSLEFLCTDGDIHGGRTYFSLTAAHNAMAIFAGVDETTQPPPTPNADWNAQDPPARGDWRLVDDPVPAAMLIDVSSLSWQGRKVRGWIAAVTNYAPATKDGIVTSLSRVEVDCDTNRAFFMVFRHLNRDGTIVDSIVRTTHADPQRLGVLASTDGAIGMVALCHPQRLNSAPGFETLTAFASTRGLAEEIK